MFFIRDISLTTEDLALFELNSTEWKCLYRPEQVIACRSWQGKLSGCYSYNAICHAIPTIEIWKGNFFINCHISVYFLYFTYFPNQISLPPPPTPRHDGNGFQRISKRLKTSRYETNCCWILHLPYHPCELIELATKYPLGGRYREVSLYITIHVLNSMLVNIISVNTLRSRPNGRHFPNIFEWIFCEWKSMNYD